MIKGGRLDYVSSTRCLRVRTSLLKVCPNSHPDRKRHCGNSEIVLGERYDHNQAYPRGTTATSERRLFVSGIA